MRGRSQSTDLRSCIVIAVVLMTSSVANAQQEEVGCFWGVPQYFHAVGPMCLQDWTCIIATGSDIRYLVRVPGTDIYFDSAALQRGPAGTGSGIDTPTPGCGLSGAQPGDSIAIPVGFDSTILGLLILDQQTLDIANFCVQQIDSFGEFCLPNALVPFDPYHNPLVNPYPDGPLEEIYDEFNGMATHGAQFNRFVTW